MNEKFKRKVPLSRSSYSDGHFWAPSCFHGSVGNGCWDVIEKYISEQHTHEYNEEK